MHQENLPAEDRYSTRLCDIIKDYHLHWDRVLKVGREFWTWPTKEIASILRMKTPDWVLITITYIRSGVIFFIYNKDNFEQEYHMDYNSDEAKILHPARMNLDELGFPFLRGRNWDTLHGRIKII